MDIPQGIFAIVSYVPEPLGSLLDELRRRLPGGYFAHAHITILPPRPVPVSAQEASVYAEHVLSQFRPFAVELSNVNRFPNTDTLYLELAHGEAAVHQMHDALNSECLAQPEQFEFRPHLTLGGPLPKEAIAPLTQLAQNAWERTRCNGRFEVEELVALWAEIDSPSEWQRLWVYSLRTMGEPPVGAASAKV